MQYYLSFFIVNYFIFLTHRFFLMINITMIDISTNPLYYAAIGGVILGIGTSLNYCLRGKVTGMSGILFGIVSCKRSTSPFIKRKSQKTSVFWEACWLPQASSLMSSDTVLPTSLPLMVQRIQLQHLLPMLAMLSLGYLSVLVQS